MTTLRHHALQGAAWALSSVTVVTVCLAVYALVDDKRLALLYAGAFAVLDLVKYLLWPTAREAVTSGRRWSAAALLGAASVLAIGSGLATAERFTSALQARTAQQQAHDQRHADLLATRAAAERELTQLDSEAEAVRSEANALRARDIATPALALENAGLARIDAQRSAARERLDSTNRELAELQAQALPVALPADLTPLLGIGLALALEIIPALLLTLARPAPATAAQTHAAPLTETTPARAPAAEPAEAEATAPAAPAPTAAQHPAQAGKFGNAEFPRPDTPLPQRIAALIARNTGDQRPPYRHPSTSGPVPDDPVNSTTPSPGSRRRPVPLHPRLTPATAT